MNIALTTIGSTGDLQPFLALALGLKQAGHRVRVCSHDLFAERFREAGIEYVAVGAPLDEARWRRTWQKLDAAGDHILRQVETLVDELFLLEAPRHFADCREAMRGFDVAICHHGDLLGQEAALRLGLPWAGVVLCPGTIPTPLNPPLHAPDLGRLGNRLQWAIGRLVMRKMQRRIAATLQGIGGSRPNLSVTESFSPTLNLLAASGSLARIAPDLPPSFVETGYWFLETPAFQPPPELAAFLEAGPAPVIVSFGSMGGEGGEATARLLVEAGRLSGERLVIQRGFGRIATGDAPPDRVHFADFTPHDYLFPRASCVVHHGGAGTTAAASRAGKPSVVAPHLADQLYWAHTLRRAGLAVEPLPRSRLTAPRLAERIATVVRRADLHRRAEDVGKRLRAERGVEKAVNAIEAWAARGSVLASSVGGVLP